MKKLLVLVFVIGGLIFFVYSHGLNLEGDPGEYLLIDFPNKIDSGWYIDLGSLTRNQNMRNVYTSEQALRGRDVGSGEVGTIEFNFILKSVNEKCGEHHFVISKDIYQKGHEAYVHCKVDDEICDNAKFIKSMRIINGTNAYQGAIEFNALENCL